MVWDFHTWENRAYTSVHGLVPPSGHQVILKLKFSLNIPMVKVIGTSVDAKEN